MCFSVPKKIIKVSGAKATLETGEEVDISGLPDVCCGEYVLINGCLAVDKVSAVEAKETRSLIKENL